MKRIWLLFSQTVTVLVAAYFVVATLQPDWIRKGAIRSSAGIALIEAPPAASGYVPPGSLRTLCAGCEWAPYGLCEAALTRLRAQK